MAVKQNLGSQAPDGSTYTTLTDGAGNLSGVTVNASDIEIGAVELKNSTTDDRASISAAGALKVEGAVTNAGTFAVQATPAGGPTTGTQSIVASSATSVTILASNANRKGAVVYNDSTQILYLILSATAASNTVYTTQMAAGSWYEVPFNYTGQITGIWASANGNARVTELT